MVLVMRKQILWRQAIEVPSGGLQPGKNDIGRDRMARIEVDRGSDLCRHGCLPERCGMVGDEGVEPPTSSV